VRITEDVEEAVREAGIAEGMVLVEAMHFDGRRSKRLIIKVMGE
jgi:thiamine phosphate synthase YjbQ (UPF0047 family)